MTDIFISYSSKDREWVEVFAGLLEAQGYQVWWDTSLLAGHDFQRMIPEKLDEAQCVIVVWTEHSVESVWVRAEASRAVIRNVLVPLQLRDAELPMPFGMFHTENFQAWSGKPEADEFQRLLRAVGQYVVVKQSRPVMSDAGGATKKHSASLFQYLGLGSKVWAAISAVLLFGLVVYAVNNFGDVSDWLWEPAAPDSAQPEQMGTLEKAGKVIELANRMKLVKIPRGSFQMGSEKGRANEKPVHTVNIAYDFWMSQTEVTFAQYDAYSDATEKDKPADNNWGRGQRPVINVSWDDAQGYVQWLSNNTEKWSCRLPSESEWEYAARAGTQTHYSWGEQIGNNRANCRGCGSQWDDKQTAPVASFKPNQFGLYDMNGNVREWVQDQLFNDYQNVTADGSARTPKQEGNGVLWNHIFRGGSWDFSPSQLRSASRSYALATYRHFSLGFRVACTAR